MMPPYRPPHLDEALKSMCPAGKAKHEYAQILDDPELTADFVRQRLESKRKWYDDHHGDCAFRPGEVWQDLVLRVVYNENLGIEVPRDGQVVCRSGKLLIVDWQSWCPVLLYCAHTGQPTLPVCSVLYHMQFQYLLSLVLPGALWTRDYSRLRPSSCCCREITFYESPSVTEERRGENQ